MPYKPLTSSKLAIIFAFAFVYGCVQSDQQHSRINTRRLRTRQLKSMANDHYLENGYTPFYFQSNENKCLDSSKDTLSATACSYSKPQYFALIDGRRRTIRSLDKSKCLQATADDSITFSVCDGKTEEQWFFRDHDKTMVSEKYDTKCLTLFPNGEVKLATCTSTTSQTLLISAVPTYVYIVFPNVETCEEKKPHAQGGWGFASFWCDAGWESIKKTILSKELVVNCRKCTTANFYPVPSDNKLKVVANQKHIFVQTANNLLVHKDTGKCITLVGDNAELRPCDSSDGQKFQYRNKELFLIPGNKKIQLNNNWLKLTAQASDVRVIPIEHHID